MKRPLVVVSDDDPTYLAMMADVLDDAGYDTVMVERPACAYGVICVHQPALVIIELFVLAPEHGLHILDQMRCHPSTSAIPAIAASTSPLLLREHTDRLHGQRCGILPKPFDLDHLFALVSQHAPL